MSTLAASGLYESLFYGPSFMRDFVKQVSEGVLGCFEELMGRTGHWRCMFFLQKGCASYMPPSDNLGQDQGAVRTSRLSDTVTSIQCQYLLCCLGASAHGMDSPLPSKCRGHCALI